MNRSLGLGFALAVVVALGAALGVAPFARAYAADSPEVLMEKVAKVMETMATIVDDNKADCDAMGDKLGKFFDDSAAVLKEGKAASAKATPEQKKAWDAKYKPRIDAAGKKMQDGLMKCHTNARVKAAMEKLKTK